MDGRVAVLFAGGDLDAAVGTAYGCVREAVLEGARNDVGPKRGFRVDDAYSGRLVRETKQSSGIQLTPRTGTWLPLTRISNGVPAWSVSVFRLTVRNPIRRCPRSGVLSASSSTVMSRYQLMVSCTAPPERTLGTWFHGSPCS